MVSRLSEQLRWCSVCFGEMYDNYSFHWTLAVTKLTVLEPVPMEIMHRYRVLTADLTV
jgi:hypothetical protein